MRRIRQSYTSSSLGQLAERTMNPTGSASQAREALNPEFERLWIEYERRLRRMIAWRLDPRLAARFSPDDILQRAAIHAAQQFVKLSSSGMKPFSWLYRIVLDELIEVWRESSAEMRDVGREVRVPSGSVQSVALGFLKQVSSPSEKAMRKELQEEIRDVLEQLRDDDREILCMRFFDDLLPVEIALIKGCGANAISTAITRAKKKLRPILMKVS